MTHSHESHPHTGESIEGQPLAVDELLMGHAQSMSDLIPPDYQLESNIVDTEGTKQALVLENMDRVEKTDHPHRFNVVMRGSSSKALVVTTAAILGALAAVRIRKIIKS